MRWSLADVAADSAYHGVRRRAALALSTGLAAVRCLDRPCLKQISVQTLQASGFFVPAPQVSRGRSDCIGAIPTSVQWRHTCVTCRCSAGWLRPVRTAGVASSLCMLHERSWDGLQSLRKAHT